MARSFSSNVQAAIDSGSAEFFMLIKLSFNATYNLTTLPFDVVYGGETYTSDGGLFEVSSPKFSSVVDREAYRVVIADDINAMLAEFKANVVGHDISVKLGFMSPDGEPYLDAEDVVDIYNGTADSPSISNDLDQRLAIVEGTSPMADLDFVNVLYTSKDGMDQRNATDTSFDDIYADHEVSLKWGKV
jgi:hypothetical protein